MCKKIIIVAKDKKAFERQLQEANINTDRIVITHASDISETEHAIKYHEPWQVFFDRDIEPRLLLDIIHESKMIMKTLTVRYKPEFLLFTSLPEGIQSCVTTPKLMEIAKALSSN